MTMQDRSIWPDSSISRGNAKRLLIVSAVLLGFVGGCAIVPGNDTYGMRKQSATALPVRKGSEIVPEHVKVRKIDAELIINLEKTEIPVGPAVAEQPSHYDYRIGPGDILNIIVWDHPELTIPAGEFRSAEAAGTVVSEDGTIFFAYAGEVKAEGLTITELRDTLRKRLDRYIENVQLDVKIAAYRSKRVYVVGEVNDPGLRAINDIPLTVIEAVNRSGGFTEEADHSQITLTRAGKTYRVDLQSLYESGNVSQNVLLLHGDILNVPDRQQNKIFVLGEVRSPGSYIMNKRRKSLAESIADAGDIDKLTANPHYVFVMRGTTDAPEIFHLNSKSPDALLLADRFALQPRDIVYVDAADIARWNRVISNIAPTFSLLQSTSATNFPLFKGTANR